VSSKIFDALKCQSFSADIKNEIENSHLLADENTKCSITQYMDLLKKFYGTIKLLNIIMVHQKMCMLKPNEDVLGGMQSSLERLQDYYDLLGNT